MIDPTASTWRDVLEFAEPRLKRALDGLRRRGQGEAETEYHRGAADVLEDLLKLDGAVNTVAKKTYPAPAPDHTHAGRARPVEPRQPTS